MRVPSSLCACEGMGVSTWLHCARLFKGRLGSLGNSERDATAALGGLCCSVGGQLLGKNATSTRFSAVFCSV